MIEIKDKKLCCGCNACGDICPKNAITFKTDIEGFWYPEVNKQLCINCGLCNAVCPIENIALLKKNDLSQSVCYAAEHKNIEVVFDSTSGGLFSALADIMYQSDGYVGGAVFNDDFSVSHYISNDKNDLPKLRSSKYLQSNLEGFYIKIKERCLAGDNVLVCGAPCQMAALRVFLGKNFENLIIVDFVCLGINSPKVWKKYIETFQDRYGSPVVYAKAKSKEYGWRNLTQKVTLANGKSYFETVNTSLFTQGYIRTGAYCRPACYDCKFKGFPRISDITIADYWGIEKLKKDRNLGTSLVMVNSQKGVEYFEKVKRRIKYQEMPFESILKGNPALVKSLALPQINRDEFFKDLDRFSFSQVAHIYFNGNNVGFKRKIKNVLKPFYKYYKINGFNVIMFIKFCILNRKVGITIAQRIKNNSIIPTKHTITEINKDAIIKVKGCLVIGQKRYKKSKLETKLLVEKNANLLVDGDFIIGYGSDIEVFKSAELKIKGTSDGINAISASNCNTTIICAEKIVIGKDVMIGRNVTIRDNNGGHYINLPGYKNAKPIIIGDKVWLCEGCTIMSGVKIGEGAIVSGGSYVTSNVPAHSIVAGNPAKVVEKNVLWKY